MLNRVSEVMHFLGHAYHSLSDIIIKARTPPPRALLCRPILIQHSAVVQTGFPIQLEVTIQINTIKFLTNKFTRAGADQFFNRWTQQRQHYDYKHNGDNNNNQHNFCYYNYSKQQYHHNRPNDFSSNPTLHVGYSIFPGR